MKISVEYSDVKNDLSMPNVVNAKYIRDYALYVEFSNGEKKEVNFGDFLKKAIHPSIKKYLDTNIFKQFKIKNGNLNWNNYDLIFPVNDLLLQRI